MADPRDEADRDGSKEFKEIKSGPERAEEELKDLGGLPGDNPFSEVVEDLRDEGESWRDVFDKIDAVYSVVDKVTYEATLEMSPEWEVEYDEFPHDNTGTTETTKVIADTREEAEAEIGQDRNREVVSVEQIGVAKYS